MAGIGGHDGPESAVTMPWNWRSRWAGIRGHDAVELAVTMGRSTHEDRQLAEQAHQVPGLRLVTTLRRLADVRPQSVKVFRECPIESPRLYFVGVAGFVGLVVRSRGSVIGLRLRPGVTFKAAPREGEVCGSEADGDDGAAGVDNVDVPLEGAVKPIKSASWLAAHRRDSMNSSTARREMRRSRGPRRTQARSPDFSHA
jgi:hypothetical protein